MIPVFLANGFEEIEALAVVDILRRAELEVVTVGIGGRAVRGAHGVTVAADMEDNEFAAMMVGMVDRIQAIVLPGGMPGTLNLEHSQVVQGALDIAIERDWWICAICAAPSILGHRGLLKGKRAVCFPGYEQELLGAQVLSQSVTVDGRIVTARGAGVAVEFGLHIVSLLQSPEDAARLKMALQCG